MHEFTEPFATPKKPQPLVANPAIVARLGGDAQPEPLTVIQYATNTNRLKQGLHNTAAPVRRSLQEWIDTLEKKKVGKRIIHIELVRGEKGVVVV